LTDLVHRGRIPARQAAPTLGINHDTPGRRANADRIAAIKDRRGA
jgi:hypothetical protein